MQFTRRRVLALLVLTCVLLLTLDARGSTTIDKGKSVFAGAFSPLKGVGRMIATPVRNGWKGITHYDELERQNDVLREQIASQKGDSIASQAALRDYQELVAQLDLPSLKDFTNVTAQVLTYSATNVQQTVEINAGKSKGIAVGMPVVNAAGLVGKVVDVFENSSLVLLITDPSYSVTVRIVGTQAEEPAASDETVAGEPPTGTDATEPTDSSIDPLDPGLEPEVFAPALPPGLVGSEEELLAAAATAPTTVVTTTTVAPTTTTVLDFNSLPNRERGSLEGVGPEDSPIIRFLGSDNRANQIKPGDAVVTDGGKESLAPAGLNVGYVKSVEPRPGSQGPLVKVEPAANLFQINYVRVIRYLPESEAPPG